jgi:hypothetical protein
MQEAVPPIANVTDSFWLDGGAPSGSSQKHSKRFGRFDDSRYPVIDNDDYGLITCLEFQARAVSYTRNWGALLGALRVLACDRQRRRVGRARTLGEISYYVLVH